MLTKIQPSLTPPCTGLKPRGKGTLHGGPAASPGLWGAGTGSWRRRGLQLGKWGVLGASLGGELGRSSVLRSQLHPHQLRGPGKLPSAPQCSHSGSGDGGGAAPGTRREQSRPVKGSGRPWHAEQGSECQPFSGSSLRKQIRQPRLRESADRVYLSVEGFSLFFKKVVTVDLKTPRKHRTSHPTLNTFLEVIIVNS